MVAGQYLSETEGLAFPNAGANGLPVIAASRTFLDGSLAADVQQLTIPAGVNVVQQLSDPAVSQVFKVFSRAFREPPSSVPHCLHSPAIRPCSVNCSTLAFTSTTRTAMGTRLSMGMWWTTGHRQGSNYSDAGGVSRRLRPRTPRQCGTLGPMRRRSDARAARE